MPAVSAAGSLATGALTATVLSEPGDLGIVLFGLTGAPMLATPLADPFCLDPNAFEFHAIAVQSAGPLSPSVNLPPYPCQRGLVVTWQVVASGPATGVAASNPAIQVVR